MLVAVAAKQARPDAPSMWLLPTCPALLTQPPHNRARSPGLGARQALQAREVPLGQKIPEKIGLWPELQEGVPLGPMQLPEGWATLCSPAG